MRLVTLPANTEAGISADCTNLENGVSVCAESFVWKLYVPVSGSSEPQKRTECGRTATAVSRESARKAD